MTTCPCGGMLESVTTALGTAQICESCGEPWLVETEENFSKHLKEYKDGKRRS